MRWRRHAKKRRGEQRSKIQSEKRRLKEKTHLSYSSIRKEKKKNLPPSPTA